MWMKQKSFTQVFLLLIVITGLVGTVFLAGQKFIFPKAAAPDTVPNPEVAGGGAVTCDSAIVKWQGYANAVMVGTANPIRYWRKEISSSDSNIIEVGKGEGFRMSNWTPAPNFLADSDLEFERVPGKIYYVWLLNYTSLAYSANPAVIIIPSCGQPPVPPPPSVLQAPTNLSVSCGFGNMAQLYWSNVEGADHYKLLVGEKGNEPKEVDSNTKDNNPYNYVTQKGITYSWQVKACDLSNNICSSSSLKGPEFACPK